MFASIVGLDLSLSHPAAFALASDYRNVYEPALVEREEWDLGPLEEQSPEAKINRIEFIAARVLEFCAHVQATNIYVENYAFSMGHSTSATKLAELGGAVRYAVRTQRGQIITPVGASAARKVFLGDVPKKGAKEWTRARVQEACANLVGADASDDLCDAFVVANFGRHDLGLPCLTLGAVGSATQKKSARVKRGA